MTAGIAQHHQFVALKVGGAQDHVHALLLLTTAMPLAKAAQLLKGASSEWLNEAGEVGKDFS